MALPRGGMVYVIPPFQVEKERPRASSSMNPTSFLQMLQGPFNFLRPDPDEIRRLLPDLQRLLPMPRPIFLEDENATPMQGFPISLSRGTLELRAALRDYVLAEEAVQVAGLKRVG